MHDDCDNRGGACNDCRDGTNRDTQQPWKCRWDGTSAGWRKHLDGIASTRFRARTDTREMNRDLAPGFYVSVARDDRGLAGGVARMLVEGPFSTHMEALVAVWPVSQAWDEVDPRSHWYYWGTAQVHGGGK